MSNQMLIKEIIQAAQLEARLENARNLVTLIPMAWQWPEVMALVKRQENLLTAIKMAAEAIDSQSDQVKNTAIDELRRLAGATGM